ncbi:sugar kinase [Paracoccus sp. Z330]|uniref:Sugar kinase n=1 Tax=Paracoccus onchidii TaxID=3017813 RepID=A0ABT4ZAG0_9RHOB|nr:sugar kinase [Paracoccus onchidii]MDB6176269.1 sugar kinase [Paracoccus onchidii]
MRYLSIGEPLVEFNARPDAESTFDRRAGGDSLNTAIYLSRLLGAGEVGYQSCLGDDPQSIWLRGMIEAEGIDVTALAMRQNARPGLYFITTDEQGERSFTYWRSQAPYRDHFNDPASLAAIEAADVLFLSAISLAVLRPSGRANLLAALKTRRESGAQVIFDTNYRPVLWEDANTAADFILQAAQISTLLLPSYDDLTACFGATALDQAMQDLMSRTEAEIVMTTGGDAVLRRAAASDSYQRHTLPPAVKAVDTTGAGDSFNAAYIAARSKGLAPEDAIDKAAALASVVVCHQGAMIARNAMPDLFS